LNFYLWVILFYLIGSIPFSYILPKIKGFDVTKSGSSNVGGTNALRTSGSKVVGFSCMFLDLFKGVIPLYFAKKTFGIDATELYILYITVVVGHNYPVWLKFKGGKGVATTAGGSMGIYPPFFFVFYLTWLPLSLITKYVSLSSLISLFIMTITGFFIHYKFGITLLILFLFSIYKHRANIKRLINGNENKTYLLGKK